MRKIGLLFICVLIKFLFNAQAPNILWQKSYGGSEEDVATSVALTSDGGYIIVGYSESNNGDVSNHHGSTSWDDYWVVKINATGNIEWQKSYGGSSIDMAYSIIQTQDGNYVIAGKSTSTNGDINNHHPGIHSYYDYWVVKLNSVGNIIWEKSLGGEYGDEGFSIDEANDGSYIVTGLIQSSGGDVTGKQGSWQSSDFWTVKLTSSGVIQWEKAMGASYGNSVAKSVKKTLDGGYIVAGYTNSYSGDVSTNYGYNDCWIVKLNQYGNIQWKKVIGGSSSDYAYSISTTNDGGYILTGKSFSSNRGFTNNGAEDLFIIKLTSAGNIEWQKSYGGSNEDVGNNVVQTQDGGYIVVGATEMSGVFKTWVLKVDNNGNLQWQKKMGGSQNDIFYEIKEVTCSEYIMVGGSKSNNGDLNINKGGYDYWIVKLGASSTQPISIQETICQGSSYEFGGVFLTTSGVYTETFSNVFGCDSVVTLNLNVTNTLTSTDVQVICDSYVWIDGVTYTSSNNTATVNLQSVHGCDSIITLDLTINNSTTGVDTQVSCGSYTWIDGMTYTSSNSTATHTLSNSLGCDSVVTLNLTINQSTTGVDTQVACGSYTWIDGVTYTSSNTTATHTLFNSLGCDSIVTLNLTINSSTTGVDTQVSCGSYTWIDGITYTSSNSTATHTLSNSLGCDSTVTLNLIVNNSATGVDTQVSCGSYTWINGITYTSSNTTATHTLFNSLGCDSIVTLNLTINSSTTGVDTQVACGSYTWIDGITYRSSNSTAAHTLSNSLGCDSVVTLNLTINQSTTGFDTQVSCGSYIWIDGITYTNSNTTATHTLSNSLGCDSVVTLNLTINQSTTGFDTQVSCGSYTWIDGMTYTSSNSTATHTLSNSLGCDSVVTLNLTINQSTTGVDTQVACGSYTWIDGMTYTSSNSTATHTLSNSLGCDSTVTLNLTINSSTTGVDTQVSCGSYTWIDGVTYTSSNTTATHTLTTTLGCDSTITLNLTINNSTAGVDTQVACGSYTWIDGVTYTNSNSTATYTLFNSLGCDSVVTLNLTINQSTTGVDTQVSCGSYTWIDGVTYTSSNTIATHTLSNSLGCDSVVTLNLTIDHSGSETNIVREICDGDYYELGTQVLYATGTYEEIFVNALGCDSIVNLTLIVKVRPIVSITELGGVLTATEGQSYQWLLNGDSIPEETGQTFIPVENGIYTISVTAFNGCSNSNNYTIQNVAMKENLINNLVIYPNPSRGKFNISSSSKVNYTIFDLYGKKVFVENIYLNKHDISLSDKRDGVYILKIKNIYGEEVIKRLIKN